MAWIGRRYRHTGELEEAQGLYSTRLNPLRQYGRVAFKPENRLCGRQSAWESRSTAGVESALPVVPATVLDGKVIHGWNPAVLSDLMGIPFEGGPALTPGNLSNPWTHPLIQSKPDRESPHRKADDIQAPWAGACVARPCASLVPAWRGNC